ncbi:MAG: hypothetical protein RIS24_3483 [Verrucomicrobiota bacterium]
MPSAAKVCSTVKTSPRSSGSRALVGSSHRSICLVAQEYLRVHRQSPCDGHPLLLAARELGGQVVGPIGQSHLHKQPHRQRARFGKRQAVHVHRGFHHIFEGGPVRKQMELLEDHPSPPPQSLTQPAVGCLGCARFNANISQAQ